MAVGARSVQLHSEERARFYAGAPPVGNERLSVVGAVLTNSGPNELTVALYDLQRFDLRERLGQPVSRQCGFVIELQSCPKAVVKPEVAR